MERAFTIIVTTDQHVNPAVQDDRSSLPLRKGILLCALAGITGLQAQMAGGVSSGMATPHEVKVSELSPSALRGDVDLFTGRYSASYPLGSVSTPGGLSYALELQYSPTATVGSIPTPTDGIPYGQGWSPNIPSITVSSVRKYALTQTRENEILGSGAPCSTGPYTQMLAAGGPTDGKVYWYEPYINIPGVASGRAVFQRVKDGEQVFVLDAFEQYVELRYHGGAWTVYVNDGKIYQFDLVQQAGEMPTNQRAHSYDLLNTWINTPRDITVPNARWKLENSISPQFKPLKWLCTRIKDPLHLPGQALLFEYATYGHFDFYKAIHQACMDQAIHLEFDAWDEDEVFDFEHQIRSFGPTTTFQDVLLERITASTTEGNTGELDLVYKNHTELIGPAMISPEASNTTDHDDLYYRQVIYSADGSANAAYDRFTGWRRYHHQKGAFLNASWERNIGCTNPYLRTNYDSQGAYYVDDVPAASGSLPFDHCFLESSNIPIALLSPGDIYEIRTKVHRSDLQDPLQIANFDISLTGGYDSGIPSPGYERVEDYRPRHEFELFSTFDRAVKWNTAGGGTHEVAAWADVSNYVETSDFFMLPYHPAYKRDESGNWHMNEPLQLRIQVGPANSDNMMNRDPMTYDSMRYPEGGRDHVSAYQSYAHSIWSLPGINTQDPDGQPENGYLSHHRLDHAFGIGLPWSMMLNVHKYLAETASNAPNPFNDITPAPSADNPPQFDPWKAPLFDFWYNDLQNNLSPYTWPNIPTLMGPDVKLDQVELVRYGKKPYMLDRVDSYVFSGEYEPDHVPQGKRLNGQVRLVYGMATDYAPQPTGLRPLNPPVPDPARYRTCEYLVSAHTIPVDPSAEVAIAPSDDLTSFPGTHFHYADPSTFETDNSIPNSAEEADHCPPIPDFIDLGPNALKSGRFLQRIIDQLGATTDIVYNDPRDRSLTEYQDIDGHAGWIPLVLDPNDPCNNQYAPSTLFSAAVTPTVKEIRRSDGSASGAVTTYSYEGQIRRTRSYGCGDPEPNEAARHLRGATNTNTNIGYRTVTVLGPEADSHRTKTVYEFYGAQFADVQTITLPNGHETVNYQSADWPTCTGPCFNDFLLFGKLKKTSKFSLNGPLLSTDETTYDPIIAFEGGVRRPYWVAPNYGHPSGFDYADYDPTFVKPALPAHPDLGNFLGTAFLDLNESEDLHISFPVTSQSSYFIRKTREVHTEFDPNGCALTEPVPWIEPAAIQPTLNPGGPGWSNGTSLVNSSYYKQLLANNGLSGQVKTELIAASPLDESVLTDAIATALPAQANDLIQVLRAQPALTNARIVQLLEKPAPFPMAGTVDLLTHQAYLSDAVLSKILQSNGLSERSKYDLLAQQNALSTNIIDQLLAPIPPLSTLSLHDLLLRAGDLPNDRLLTLIHHPIIPAELKGEVLAKQAYIATSILNALIIEPSITPEMMRHVIVHGHRYPSDAVMVALLAAHPDWPLPILRDLLMASGGSLSPVLRASVEQIPGLVASLPAYTSDWPEVKNACGQPCTSSNIAVQTFKDYQYFDASPTGVTTAEGYKRLFGWESLPSFQLKWQPSWLPYSVKTWSPQFPGAYTIEEDFYYQDLRNRYDRIPGLLAANEPVRFTLDEPEEPTDWNGVLLMQPWLDGNREYSLPNLDLFQRIDDALGRPLMTSVPFQHRTRTRINPAEQEVIKNVFYEYRSGWNEQPTPLTESSMITEPGEPCASIPTYPLGGGPQFTHYPPVVGTWYVDNINIENAEAYCIQVPPGHMLVHSVPQNDQDPYNDDTPPMFFVVPLASPGDDYSSWFGSSFVSVCSVVAVPGGNGNGSTPIQVEYGQQARMKPIPGLLKTAFQLYRTDVQADEHTTAQFDQTKLFNEDLPLLDFVPIQTALGDTLLELRRTRAILPFPTITKERVLTRNAFQQAQVVENERGLRTQYDFDRKRYKQHVNLLQPCNSYFSSILDHPGLPTSMVQDVQWYDPDGNGEIPGDWVPRTDALTTSFSYYPNNSLANITDPNGKVIAYTYDTYGRLKESRTNGAITAEYRYHQWHFAGTDPATYAYDHIGATLENYVETGTRNHTDDESGVLSRTYLDPLGRAYNTLTRAVNSTKEPEDQDHLVSAGKTEYDPWGRVISTFEPFVYTTVGSTFPLSLTQAIHSATPNVHRDTRYEMDPRGRPLFTTEPGVDITAVNHLHNTKQRYQLLRHEAFACALELSAAEVHLLAPINFENTIWRMSETEDPDGNITREYANALGQKVATQAWINGTEAAVTLFVYDAQGNLAISINPEKQHTTCKYNLLGQLYQKTTVDGGTTKYLYDRSGNVVLEQDEELRDGEIDGATALRLAQFRKHTFDLFNRPVAQSRVRMRPPASNVNAPGIFSYPVDVLAYQTTRIGLDNNNELLDEDWQGEGHTPAWACDFSCASTQAELATVQVIARPNTVPPNSPASLHTLPITDLIDLLDTLPEKQWKFDYSPLAASDNNIPTNTIYGDVGAMIDQHRDPVHLRGRLSHTITWPHRTFSEFYSSAEHTYHFATAGEPVLYDFLSYNNEGQVEWQYQQFNPNRIAAGSPGLGVRIDYPAYDLRGNLLAENIDANCDGLLDMHYDYAYDGWGRLHQVFASLSDQPGASELLAENTYDDAKGRLTHTTYYRTCEEVSFPVDELDYTFDLRDRLTAITGRAYAEQVLYDGLHPTWNGNNLLADHHWNGLINGTISTYVPAQFFNSADVQGRFDQPTTYGYHYDQLGRLIRADAVQGSVVNGVPWAHPLYTVGDERYAFDRIGNITALERHVLPDANPAMEGWSYAYQPTTNRLVGAELALGSTAPARHYTYDRNGNLVSDSFRHLASVHYGRANLPFDFALPNGLQNYEDVDRGRYLYNAADARIYKFIDRHDKGASDAAEFYLNDAMGRSLGVLDLIGDPFNNENKSSSWDWYVFSAQRFARVHPAVEQQPSLYDADLGRREMADVTNSEYIGVRNMLTALDEVPGGISYPLHIVHVIPQGAPELWLTREVFDSLSMADPALLDQTQRWYTFTSKKAPVSLKRSNAPHDEVLISAQELISEGQLREGDGPAVAPFHYTYGTDTRLAKVYYYEYDHLGNTRATFSDDCKDKNGNGADATDEVLEELADYYPYGKILREFVNGMEEKYLTTQHQRDQETGLDYRGARYYDSDVARFLSLDPLAADYASWSAYNYVLGNPISLTDPSGRSATKYEDEAGNLLGNTNDGNDATVTVGNANVDSFKKEFAQAEDRNEQNGMMNNESWIRRYGDRMSVAPGGKAASWAAGALGYDANALIPAAIGTAGTALEENATQILLNRARYDFKGAPYEPLRFPTKNVTVRTPFGGLEMPKSTLGKIGLGLKVGGYAMGAYQAVDLYNQKQQGLIGGSTYYLEQGTNAFSTFGGIYGAAWSVGWESGRYIMGRPAVRDWMQNTWYPWREQNLGY